MKKLIFLLSIFCLFFFKTPGQTGVVNSLTQQFSAANNDTVRFILYDRLCYAYLFVNYDSSLFYGRRAVEIIQEFGYPLHEAKALLYTSISQLVIGNLASGMEMLNRARSILEEPGNSHRLLSSNYLQMLKIAPNLQLASRYKLYLTGILNEYLAYVHYDQNNIEKARFYAMKEGVISETLQAKDMQVRFCLLMGNLLLDKPDSALLYLKKGYQLSLETGYKEYLGEYCNYIAKAYNAKKEKEKDLLFKQASLRYNLEQGNLIFTGWSYLSLADFYKVTPAADSTIFYCHKALEIARATHNPPMEYWSSAILKDTYKALKKIDSAFVYMERMIAAKDKYASDQQVRELQSFEYNQLLRQKDFVAARTQYQHSTRMYLLSGGLVALLLIAGLLWRNIRHKQKAYVFVQQQKKETEKAYELLKGTQAQMLQQEKMASLGELTAGIAHEIQNPLNFVNNFSEVNTELIGEMETEIDKGNLKEIKVIAKDIKENEQKINHHGKRADAIVKGMLQHSRSSTSQKEPTDINKLAEEYLRLAYHGLRAKDNFFNATMKTDFDERIGNVNIIPQDIGRVIVNLITNAFYAVNQKRKQNSEEYEPTVKVSTKKIGGNVEIKVSDNGNGIPQTIVDKIFQPFFTTKPTGQGTGLGLSLSYDIVKAHGGEIKMETEEGKGAEFVVQLPFNNRY